MGLSRGAVLAALCAFIVVALATVPEATSADEEVEVTFGFHPLRSSYEPGTNFSINLTVTNVLADMSAFGSPNDIEVFRISAQFTWMAPNAWASEDVDDESVWLLPGESQTFSLNMTAPSDLADATYGYVLKVEYRWRNAWGVSTPSPWVSITYRDFVVKQAAEEGTSRWTFVIAGIALVLAAGAVGAVLYHTTRRQGNDRFRVTSAETLGLAEMPSSPAAYPVIRAAAGERFPIEKGVIYLVKEKRPGIGFAMFREAVAGGARGMLISREHPERLRRMHEFEASKILWLTRRVGVDHIDPTELSLLSLEITKFVERPGKSVVLIEGLEYVITQNNFESVLRFVNHLHDFVLAHECAVIVILDPRVLSTRELALLERSARIVEVAEPVVTAPEGLAEELET